MKIKFKNRQRYGHLAAGTAAVALLALTPISAAAQSTAANTNTQAAPVQEFLGEIIVTARRRNETLISVPVAVSAVNEETLANFGVTDVRSLANYSPGLAIDRVSSGAGATITLRGIGTSPGQAGFEQTVSLNLDGVQTSRGRAITQGLFDVGHVEVLKGPQALFFGKNSPAGVISITSAGPTDEVSGYARLGYETVADEAIAEAAVGGPVSDSVGARLAVRYRKMDGWLRNIGGPVSTSVPGVERPGDEEAMGRLTLTWKPSDSNFDATLKMSASDYSDDGPAAGQQLFYCGALPAGGVAGRVDPYGDCKFDKYYSSAGLANGVADNWPYASQQPYSDVKVYLASLSANYSWENLALTSVTGYFSTRSRTSDSYDATSYYIIGAAEREDFDAFSQELRLLSSFEGPVNFMLGAYYQDSDLYFVNNSRIALLPADPATGKYHSWEKPSGTKGKAYSGFGQLIWAVTPEVELAGGVRYTRETKDSYLYDSWVHPLLAASFLPPTTILKDNFRDSNYSPEATLTWRPTSEITTYIAYKTGYKSGGLGLSAVLTPKAVTADDFNFEAEKVRGEEIGLKAQLFDKKLTLTTAAYSYLYSNLQVNAFNAALASFTVTNAASARSKGFEIDANLRVTPDLTIYGSVAYNRSRYKEFISSCYGGQTLAMGCDYRLSAGADGINGTADDRYGQNMSGRPLTRAADWSLNGGFDYTIPLSGAWDLGLSGNARYTSKINGTDNSNPGGLLKGYWVLDAAARLEMDRQWEISLVGRNLNNAMYGYLQEKPGSPTTPGTPSQVFAIPTRGRQVLVQVGYTF